MEPIIYMHKPKKKIVQWNKQKTLFVMTCFVFALFFVFFISYIKEPNLTVGYVVEGNETIGDVNATSTGAIYSSGDGGVAGLSFSKWFLLSFLLIGVMVAGQFFAYNSFKERMMPESKLIGLNDYLTDSMSALKEKIGERQDGERFEEAPLPDFEDEKKPVLNFYDLDDYLENSLMAGKKAEDILQYLLLQGWTKEMIGKRLAKIEKRLAKGENNEEV
jgi:hypothetical protein